MVVLGCSLILRGMFVLFLCQTATEGSLSAYCTTFPSSFHELILHLLTYFICMSQKSNGSVFNSNLIVNFGQTLDVCYLRVAIMPLAPYLPSRQQERRTKGDEVKVRLETNEWYRPMYVGNGWGKNSCCGSRYPCKSTAFPFQIGPALYTDPQDFGGVPVCEICECTAASADDAAPLCLTTPPSQDMKW